MKKITFETLKNYPNKINNTKKRIGILIDGKTNYYSTSSYIRLLSPLNEISNDFSIRIIDNDSDSQFYNDLLNNNKILDVLILQRDIIDKANLDSDLIKSLFKILKKNNIKIIFDIDDDLLNIDKTHVDYDKYSNLKDILEFIITQSDLITVSTEYLKNQLIELNKNIIIIPNTLLKLWDLNQKQINKLNSRETITIGYFGTRTHGQDLQIIKTAITNIKERFPKKNILIETVGISYENQNWIKKHEIPNNYKDNPTIKDKLKNFIQYFLNKFNLLPSSLPYCDFIKWIKNETKWDIGIAPLEDNNINKSKSNLKYLEYTALNIPGIYSDIGPYKEIKLKKTGLVVNNNVKEWADAFINLIENEELYETLVNNAYKYVKKNYMVENASLTWKQILIKI